MTSKSASKEIEVTHAVPPTPGAGFEVLAPVSLLVTLYRTKSQEISTYSL